MKARWVILGALLLTVLVSPSGMRAMPRTLSAPACRIANPQIRTSYEKQRHELPREAAYSLPGQHRPAPRLHRNRGKKISIQRGFMTAQGCPAPGRYIFSMTLAQMQDPAGPNPSRGPPAQSL